MSSAFRTLFVTILTIMFIPIASSVDSKPIFTNDWFKNNISFWHEHKKYFKDKPNIRCLEIGSWEGQSVIYIAENYCNGEGSFVDSVDTWEGSVEHSEESKVNLYERFLYNTQKYIDNGRIVPHRMTSKKALLDFISEGIQYDFIYIDGSHLAYDVMVDTVLSWELLKVGGILIFDDYEGGSPRQPAYVLPKPAIDGFLASYNTMYEVLHKGYQVHIKKIANSPKYQEAAEQ